MKIKEYWNIIGWEPFLVIPWEPDFSQACSFRRMLMKHKSFHFTQIPDKTNDVIFLKSPKLCFGTISKTSATHNDIWTPNTMLCFRKLMSQFRENLGTDGRTEGKTDRQTLFYRTLPAEAGGPTRDSKFL